MAIEISVIAIAIAAVILVVFLVLTLIQTKKTLKSTKNDLHRVSREAICLMEKIEELTSDIKSKSEALNFAFKPLKTLNKHRSHHREHDESDTVEQVIDWISTSLVLYNKIKSAVKDHERR